MLGRHQNIKALEKKVAQLETLNRLARAISSTHEVDRILEIILHESMKICDADDGSILTLSATDKRPMQTLYKAGNARKGDKLSRLSDIVSGWVIRNRKPLIAENITSDPRFRTAGKWLTGFTAVMAVPMIVQGKNSGIIILTKSSGFSKDDLDLLPIIANQCAQFIENARQFQEIYHKNIELRKEIEKQYDFCGLIGQSSGMTKVFELLKRIIPGETRILIEGESGTGKELIARIIHYNGPRKNKKFITVDCGALPENLLESELFGHIKGAFTGAVTDKKGLFEVAHQGTLFLDEISNTTPAFQAKLLRAIQEGEIKPIGAAQSRKVDVRILAATSGDLKSQVKNGQFRKDLYFRLNVIAIETPPLRQRRSDIRLLAEHFLKNFLQRIKPEKKLRGFSSQAMRLLELYDWPGNIRELENTVERTVALALPDEKVVTADHLPSEIVEPHSETGIVVTDHTSLVEYIADVERSFILKNLKEHDNNRTRCAKSLGITRPTLLSKMKKYNIL